MAVTSAKFASANDGTGNGSYTPSTNPQVGIRYGRNYNGIITRKAYNNTAYTTQKFGRKRSWALNYTHLNSTDKGRLEVLFEYTVGQLKPFYFSEDGSNYSYQVRFTQSNLEFTEVAYNVFSTQLTFEEV
tara:strand:- start:219 stop:608 length:390 start_codon:yes stop_codon:yes gene_type:complete